MSPHRVLFCRSNPIAPDPRVEKEARALHEAGYAVSAVGWDRSATLPTQESKDGIQIHRLPIRARFGAGLANLPALLRWQAGLLTWLIRYRQTYDLIHACDFDTILPALFVKHLFGKKVIYDIFDFYADHLRRTPQAIKSLIRALDYRAIAAADAVILVDDARREQISGAHPKHLAIIYNAPEDLGDAIQPEESAYPPNTQFRLAYIGLLQIERGLLEMLSVLERHPQWGLVIAGFGGDEESIAAKSRSLPNVRFLGRVDYAHALRLSRAADALFATYDPTIPNHRYSSPNKVFESMMLGKPVIVCQDTNMDQIIQQARCGLVVPYGDIPALESALTQLASDITLRQQLGQNGRNAYETQYGWHIMQQRLLEVYQSIQ